MWLFAFLCFQVFFVCLFKLQLINQSCANGISVRLGWNVLPATSGFGTRLLLSDFPSDSEGKGSLCLTRSAASVCLIPPQIKLIPHLFSDGSRGSLEPCSVLIVVDLNAQRVVFSPFSVHFQFTHMISYLLGLDGARQACHNAFWCHNDTTQGRKPKLCQVVTSQAWTTCVTCQSAPV